MKKFLKFLKICIFWLLILSFCKIVNSSAVHNHLGRLNKEHEKDGAYSPRNADHFSESGEHHSEFDHEAILGSAKEAEEFDQLTPEESKRRLTIILKKMDLNKDEHIDRRELKLWILRSFKMLSDEEANERFEDADDDGDGKITWTEYLLDTYGSDGNNETLSLEQENEEFIKDDKLMWKAADTNGDGNMQRSEWVMYTHPEEHPVMHPIIVDQTLRDKDTDKDGEISFQEYIGDQGQRHDKAWLEGEKDRFDKDLDKNRDGKLSAGEILQWVVPSNEEIAEEEAEHLFAASDDDHDDTLSFDEILDHYDTFVGSEATDYGDHLHNIHHFQDEL